MRIEDRRRGGRTKKEEREAQIRMLCSRNSSCCTGVHRHYYPIIQFQTSIPGCIFQIAEECHFGFRICKSFKSLNRFWLQFPFYLCLCPHRYKFYWIHRFPEPLFHKYPKFLYFQPSKKFLLLPFHFLQLISRSNQFSFAKNVIHFEIDFFVEATTFCFSRSLVRRGLFLSFCAHIHFAFLNCHKRSGEAKNTRDTRRKGKGWKSAWKNTGRIRIHYITLLTGREEKGNSPWRESTSSGQSHVKLKHQLAAKEERCLNGWSRAEKAHF